MAEIPELLDPETEVAADLTLRAVPQVGKVAILAVTLGMILSVDAIVRGFFGDLKSAVGWIPFAGKVVTAPITKIEQKVVSFLSGLEQDVDTAMGHATHNTAVLVGQLWHIMENTAWFAITWPYYLDQAIYSAAVKPFMAWVRRQIRHIEAEVTHPVRTIVHVTRVITKTVVRTETHLRKIVTVAVPKYIHRELLQIRKEAMHAERNATRALRKAENIPFPKNAKTFAEAIALTLPKLGLEWLNCQSNPFKNNPNACSVWNDLKDLLGLVADLLLFTRFCDLWAEAEPLFGVLLSPVVAVISTFADGACSHRPGDWELIGAPLFLPVPDEITETLPAH